MKSNLRRVWNALLLAIRYRGGLTIANAAIVIAHEDGLKSHLKGYSSDLYTWADDRVRITLQMNFDLVAFTNSYQIQVEQALEVPGNWEIVFECTVLGSGDVLLFNHGTWVRHILDTAKPIQRRLAQVKKNRRLTGENFKHD